MLHSAIDWQSQRLRYASVLCLLSQKQPRSPNDDNRTWCTVIRESAAHRAFQLQLDAMVEDSGVGQEVIGMVLARTSLRAPNETSRWHLERGSDARPVDRRVLRQATVSKAVRALTKRGFLEEGERQLKSESEDGRRARSLESLRFGRGVVIAGVHVEQRGNVPKSITAVLVGLDSNRGLAAESRELAGDTHGWKGVARAIHDLVADLKMQLDAQTRDRLAAAVDAADVDFDPSLRAQREEQLAAFTPFELFGVGVEVGAPVFDGAIASIARAGGATKVDYQNFEEELQELFTDGQGSITPVVIENDVNALAVLAIHEEHYAVPDLAVIGVFDEGVGAGLVLDGRLRRGGNGTAMEIGHLQVVHVPGSPGAVDYQGDQAPPAEELPRTFDDLCECGRNGHVDTRATPSRIAGQLGVAFDDAVDLDTDEACETFRSAGFALGRAIAHVSNIVNPTRIIVYLPTRLARPMDDTAAAEYRPAATAEICAAFGNAGREQAEFLTYRPLATEDVASLCARAAAVCLLQGFIEHALRVDGCSFSTNRKVDATR